MVGPQFFRDSQKPQYPLGIGAMIFAFTMMAFCGIIYWSVFAKLLNLMLWHVEN